MPIVRGLRIVFLAGMDDCRRRGGNEPRVKSVTGRVCVCVMCVCDVCLCVRAGDADASIAVHLYGALRAAAWSKNKNIQRERAEVRSSPRRSCFRFLLGCAGISEHRTLRETERTWTRNPCAWGMSESFSRKACHCVSLQGSLRENDPKAQP